MSLIRTTHLNIVSIAGLLLALGAVPSSARADALITVCPTGGGDYTTIQAGIDAAVNGDIIELCPGGYLGGMSGNSDISFNGKAVTVRCATGNYEDCVMFVGGPGVPRRGFIFDSGEGPDSVLESVKILSGFANWPGGGGIYIEGASPTIENCYLAYNTTSAEGGGIYCDDGDPIIRNCVFFNNSSTGIGGGMIAGWNSSAQITDCAFIENTSDDDGGGLAIFADALVEDCIFDGNHCAGHGGGMMSISTQVLDPTIRGCRFTHNSAGNPPNWGAGGGLSVNTLDFGTAIEFCTFIENSATGAGGGAYIPMDTTYATFDNCTFHGNSAPAGGGLYFDNSCGAMNNTIIANSLQGGSVGCNQCPTVPATCSDVFGNAGGDWISCIAPNTGIAGNITLDPMCCDVAAADLTLDSGSPCAPFSAPNPQCDLIGAWPVACGDLPCVVASDCADLDDNGIRDDGCVWWECDSGTCVSTSVDYADMGGNNGVCPPDGTADANDRFHALNCFSDEDTLDNPDYPCEVAPPSAFNVDAAGLDAPCDPDGVCDANDAFAALNAFDGSTTCSCDGGPMPGSPVRPPAGPATAQAHSTKTASAVIRLLPSTSKAQPGDLVEVDVLLDVPLSDLRGYQLHATVDGRAAGALELVDLVIDKRRDHVFAGSGYWDAYNLSTRQLLAGLDTAGVSTSKRGSYLATLVYEVTARADGTCVVDLLHADNDPAQRTVLFATPEGRRIAIAHTVPAVIAVGHKTRR